jgi:glycosyltransferase involved in cell wall biosynthesis
MKILWLKTELLHPVDKGGKIRTYQMLKELCKDQYVTYLTLDDGTADPDAKSKALEYCNELITIPHQTSEKFSMKFYWELAKNVSSPLPYALQKYVSPAMRAKIKQLAVPKTYDVVVCDFLTPAVNLPDKLDVGTLLFQHNVEAVIWQRHFELSKNPLKKTFFHKQWRNMFDFEKEACWRFDWVTAVSKDDVETMKRDYDLDNVSDIPTGVDVEYFKPTGEFEKEPFNLVFTGSMDWLPNEDAINWFTAEILPLIKARFPNVTLTVVGRNPLPSLVNLSKKDPSIIVTGRVPDVRPFMEKASVYIVPIRIGGGTRLKIYEAMAMELPIVSTTIGAEGLPVNDGEDIFLRDTPEEFADTIVSLLSSKELAQRTGAQAAYHVRQNFGWDKVTEKFVEDCQRAKQLLLGKRWRIFTPVI